MVESVRDGTTLRVRLFMPDGEHQFVNITLAGARSPRAASKQGETSEPSGDEVSWCRSLTNAARALVILFKLCTVGEIFYRIASTSTHSQSTTSFTTNRDRHAVPDQW